MKYTIFSIDDEQDASTRIGFRLMFAMSDARGNLIECRGSYKGKTENAFMCRSDDFDAFVWGTGWVDEQESVLRVSECNKQYARLDYADFSNPVVDEHNPVRSEGIGSLKSVSEEEAMQHAAWTYRPDLNIYWIAVEGNPDHTPPAGGW